LYIKGGNPQDIPTRPKEAKKEKPSNGAGKHDKPEKPSQGPKPKKAGPKKGKGKH
jgi:hypothetical protein